MSPFCSFIPNTITENCAIFDENTIQNNLHLIHPDFPNGPAKFCYWFFDSKAQRASFSVALLNSLQNPERAFSFHIPLTIPLSKPWISTFFKLLKATVDLFGKESLNEEEEGMMRKIITHDQYRYSLPDDILQMKGSPEEIFDAFLSCSPFLKHLWQNNEQTFGSDLIQVKIALYSFIKTLRSNYKKAFFVALSPQTQVQIEKDMDLYDFEKGLKGKDRKLPPFEYEVFFKSIYQETNQMNAIPSNYTSKMSLDSHTTTFKIEPVIVDEEDNHANNQISITMVITSPEKSEQLSIIYSSFLNETHFLKLMQWQVHLVQNYYFKPI
jgi:hypothetical protein